MYMKNRNKLLCELPPKLVFLLVSFSLGNLGDGLNIFQGVYLVNIGWNEASVGIALSLMSFTALVIQPWAGDWVDKTSIDRRVFLTAASIVTAMSASTILIVKEGNTDHMLIFCSKIIEGIASSFVGPCLAALTLATFGPNHFDAIMASNILWGHVGSVVAAVLAGFVAYVLYPNIKFCFIIIGLSALVAVLFIHQLPQGDPLMGRGFQGKVAMDEYGTIEHLESDESTVAVNNSAGEEPPKATSYWEVFSDRKTCILCVTGFFFHFANANVLLVLGEMMGKGGGEDGSTSRSTIPLTAGAIVLAQFTMAIATSIGNRLTMCGVGRKPLFMIGLMTLPIRCALIILWSNAGAAWLLSTQILDGLGGGVFGLVHPYLIADIAFGTGRFNVLMGLSASFFGMGATLSNVLGQYVVQKYGHVTSLAASLFISIIPILLFMTMPETMGRRGVVDSKSLSKADSYTPIP